ncbi:glycosyltransferase family 2 protein [Clostridium cibarium]|uniref:Glycosyltransferase family 2 protein n=1 Tax=Clostridium cibarium TaxID=2762247 RepID=A0ABR8PXJ2_9CLOT|nr:glycosyltransferase family 2 protein [Clostridium cibarium]MBD7912898.1 glycosyltransferase family 2 protein [Clostridium cibarium]
MDKVLVSVIIPTYNREKTLPRSINSVLNQTVENFELLIVDDRSTDNTKDMITEYMKKDKRIKYIVNTNTKGVAGARNSGIKNSVGKYIAFLDSDDEWECFHLEKSIELIEKTNSTVCFAYWHEKHGDSIEDIGDSEEIKMKLNSAVQASCVTDYNDYFCLEKSFLEFSIINYFYCYHINTLVMERENINITGKFREDLFTSEDVDLVLRIIDKCKVVIHKKAHFIYYDDGDNNLYSYIDRENVEISKVMKDKEIVAKLTFDGENKNNMRKYLKLLVNKSDNIKNRTRCIDIINKRIEEKYYTLAFINSPGIKSVKYARKLFFMNRNFSNFKFFCRCVFSSKKHDIYNFDFN